MQRLKNNDRGQSGTIVAILMVPLMAMLALAIDVGAMHLDKQQLQTGADAAALAIAQDCAHNDCSTANITADSMAKANFHGDGASGTVTALNVVDRTVTVQTSTIREHWFAPIIGIHATPIQATASAQWEDPVGTAAGVFPLAFSWCAMQSLDRNASEQILYLADSNCTDSSGKSVPGGSGWLTPTDSTCSMLTWVEDGWAKSNPGNNPQCANAIRQHVGKTVLLPVFDAVTGQGNNAKYRISQYAAFTISGYNLPGRSHPVSPPCSGSDRCVSGTFDGFIPLDQASGTNPYAAVVTLTE